MPQWALEPYVQADDDAMRYVLRYVAGTSATGDRCTDALFGCGRSSPAGAVELIKERRVKTCKEVFV